MTMWRMHIEWWIRKATNTHSEYVILLLFPVQQRLHERFPMLRLQVNCLLFMKVSLQLIDGLLWPSKVRPRCYQHSVW